jgi:hypothetical protein
MPMPNRIVRDGILESEAVLSLPPEGRWLYVTILLSADDYGLFEATTFKLAKRADIKREHVPALVQTMIDSDLVRLYWPDRESARVFGFVTKFAQRLRIRRAKYPLPPIPLLAGEDEELINKIKHLASQMSDTCPPVADACRPEAETETETETEKDNTVATLRVAAAPAAATRNRTPSCPTEALVALWHEHCAPPLAAVGVVNDARKQAMATRWREVCAGSGFDRAAGLEWFRWLLAERVAASDFLMGRRPGRNGTEPWRASWDWLMGPRNFAKVVDGNYVNGKVTR